MTESNPFIVQREIAYGEPFCDREEELATFIESASRGEGICLLSPRRYGKSSLINQVLGNLRDQGWLTIRVDLMEVFSIQDLVRELESKRLAALSLWKQIRKKSRDALSQLKSQAGIDPLSGLPTFSLELTGNSETDESFLREALRKICSLAEETERPVCLALDEFQEVAVLDTKRRIEGVFRAVFQKRPQRFTPFYLGSKRHMLKLMFEDVSAPFFRSARVLEIGPLSHEKFHPFMKDQFRKTLELEMPDEIVSATCALFGGHPYALNKTASYLWTRCAIEKTSTPVALKSLWKSVILGIMEEERSYYEVANRGIPRYAMKVLQRIALAGQVSEPYSAEFARSCSLTPGQIQNALRILVREDKVMQKESGLSILDPLERLCLRIIGRKTEEQAAALDQLLSTSSAQI